MSVLEKFRLDGQTAIVTGAGRGLGRAMAQALAEAGAAVLIAEIEEDAGRAVADELRERGLRAAPFVGDVAVSSDARAMVEAAVREFGALDILVNNAGTTSNAPFEDSTDEGWERVVRVNLSGTAYSCKWAGKQMIAQGRGGKIINVSSISGFVANRDGNNTPYCASKGGVIALTRSLAVEWAKYNIRVNSIAPGYFATPMTDRIRQRSTALYQQFLERVPLGRFGQPDELGGVVVFLASDASSFISGHILVTDGAYTAW